MRDSAHAQVSQLVQQWRQAYSQLRFEHQRQRDEIVHLGMHERLSEDNEKLLRRENASLKQALAEHADAAAKLKRLRAENETLREDLDDARASVCAGQLEHEARQAELRRQLDAEIRDRREAQRRLDAELAACAKLRDELEARVDENALLAAELKECRELLKTKEQEYRCQVIATKLERDEQVARLEGRLQRLQTSGHDACRQQLATLQQELERARSELALASHRDDAPPATQQPGASPSPTSQRDRLSVRETRLAKARESPAAATEPATLGRPNVPRAPLKVSDIIKKSAGRRSKKALATPAFKDDPPPAATRGPTVAATDDVHAGDVVVSDSDPGEEDGDQGPDDGELQGRHGCGDPAGLRPSSNSRRNGGCASRSTTCSSSTPSQSTALDPNQSSLLPFPLAQSTTPRAFLEFLFDDVCDASWRTTPRERSRLSRRRARIATRMGFAARAEYHPRRPNETTQPRTVSIAPPCDLATPRSDLEILSRTTGGEESGASGDVFSFEQLAREGRGQDWRVAADARPRSASRTAPANRSLG
ncbi:hypothetical protein MTO96_006281 [Rhipicephalus appendiculatus]